MKVAPRLRPDLSWLVLLAAALVVGGLLLLPYPTLESLLERLGWLGRIVDRLEEAGPQVDMVHLVAFAGLGLVARLVLPGVAVGWILAGLAVFGLGTEVAQVWAPGRTPEMGDLAADLGGAVGAVVVGAVFVAGVRCAHRQPTKRVHRQPAERVHRQPTERARRQAIERAHRQPTGRAHCQPQGPGDAALQDRATPRDA